MMRVFVYLLLLFGSALSAYGDEPQGGTLIILGSVSLWLVGWLMFFRVRSVKRVVKDASDS